MTDEAEAGVPEPLLAALAGYSDLYPYPNGLQRELEEITRDAQRRARKKVPPKTFTATAKQWEELGKILALYLNGQRLNAIVLRKADRNSLKALSEAAAKFVSAFTVIGRSNPPRAMDFLREWLEDREIAVQDFVHAFRIVDSLAGLRPDADFHYHSAWPNIQEVRRGAISRGFFTSHLGRGGLQLRLDEWWKSTTGLSAMVWEADPTSYQEFLGKLLSPMQWLNAPGYSATAVKKARSEGRREAKRVLSTQDLLEALQRLRDHPRDADAAPRDDHP
jgi:hypothetical protein